MSDIICTVPWTCDFADGCERGWHLTYYWIDFDGEYTECDEDGDHSPIEASDIPSTKEQDKLWRSYFDYCINTGLDPLGEFTGKTTKLDELWQIQLGNSILGVVLVGARRARRDRGSVYGRGAWLTADDVPEYVTDYVLFKKKGERFLCMDDKYTNYRGYAEMLEACDDVTRCGLGKYVVRVIHSYYQPPSPSEVKQRARRARRAMRRR